MADAEKIVVAFLTLSTESSTDKLIEHIADGNSQLSCISVKLTHQDLQLFEPRGEYDVVVLLHSISQGRNSITDVADAKYSKLLPQLKQKYGPYRVAVVVHSMTSFSDASKTALMLVFRKSQPTTFECSKCVIQCNNPAKMPEEDLLRLLDFIKEAQCHQIPISTADAQSSTTVSGATEADNKIESHEMSPTEQIPDTESTPTNITTTVNESKGIGYDSNSPNGLSLGTATGGEQTSTASSLSNVASTDIRVPTGSENSTYYNSASSQEDGSRDGLSEDIALSTNNGADQSLTSDSLVDKPPDDNITCPILDLGDSCGTSCHPIHTAPIQYPYPSYDAMHGASGGGACHSNRNSNPAHYPSTYPTGSALSTGPVAGPQHVPDNRPNEQRINTDFPVALVVQSSNLKAFEDDVQPCFPGKMIYSTNYSLEKLRNNWHLQDAILIDVGESRSLQPDQIRMIMNTVVTCVKKMYAPGNIALLMPFPVNQPPSEFERSVCQLAQTYRVHIFYYRREAGRQFIFDDVTRNQMVHWIRDCYHRHLIFLKPGRLERAINTVMSLFTN